MADQSHQEIQDYKSACPADACAAMHGYRRLFLIPVAQQCFYQRQQMDVVLSRWYLPIWPAYALAVNR